MPSPSSRERLRGWPSRFPVRDDDRRPLRYRACSALCRAVFRTVYGRELRIEGAEGLVAEGPLLVACNHLSNLDPLILGGFFPATLHAMAKRSLFRGPVMAWLLAGCNVFPVDRGTADRQALRTAVAVLQRGGRLLVFLEGTRAARPGMRRAEPGAGFLLRRTGVPLLPVAVWGTERALVRGRRLPRRVPLHVRYGRVVPPPPGGWPQDNAAAADLAAAHVAALLPQEYRGVYAEAARSLENPASSQQTALG